MKRSFYMIIAILMVTGCASGPADYWPSPPPQHLQATGEGASMEGARSSALQALSQQILVQVDSQTLSQYSKKEEGDQTRRKKFFQSVTQLMSSQQIPGAKVQTKLIDGLYRARVLLNKPSFFTWAKEKLTRLDRESKKNLDEALRNRERGNTYGWLSQAAKAYKKSNQAYTTYLMLTGMGVKTSFSPETYQESSQIITRARSELKIWINIREKWGSSRAPAPVLSSEIARKLGKKGIPVEVGYPRGQGGLNVHLRGWVQATFSSRREARSYTAPKSEDEVNYIVFYRVRDNIKMVFGRKVLFSSAGAKSHAKGGGKSKEDACREAMKDRAEQLIPETEKAFEKLLPTQN